MRVWQPGEPPDAARRRPPRSTTGRGRARRGASPRSRGSPRRTRRAPRSRSSRSLAATLTALAPPYLAKLAIDEGIRGRDLDQLTFLVALLVAAGLASLARELRADVLHRLDGRAHPRRPARPALPPPAAPVARLLRAQPRRRDHQPPDERRRRARPARHRRRHGARPEHAAAGRLGRDPLPARLAARARDADRDPAHGGRDGALPAPLLARLPRRPRAARPRHGHARRGHRRHARAPGLHARARQPAAASARSTRATAPRTTRPSS